MRNITTALLIAVTVTIAQTKPYTETKILETPHYRITITQVCEEYVIGCNHVFYHGVSRKSGSTVDLKGEQEMSMCADGKTPCHLIGWRFKKDITEYFVSDSGVLLVSQGKKELMREAGKWKE
jgi:hypothetical protein